MKEKTFRWLLISLGAWNSCAAGIVFRELLSNWPKYDLAKIILGALSLIDAILCFCLYYQLAIGEKK